MRFPTLARITLDRGAVVSDQRLEEQGDQIFGDIAFHGELNDGLLYEVHSPGDGETSYCGPRRIKANLS